MPRRPPGMEVDPLISEYQHDSHRHRPDEALHTLRKIASLVKPIMRQRNWRVQILCEFFPEQGNLLGLNINQGQKICLRLRYPGDQRQFLPIEDVVDTMLHELCHNVHGPHDQHFHALWNQLREEHEALLRKGYTGEGFLSKGKKLGGSGYLPMHEARRRARAAAEKRKILNAGSGRKLGGAPVMRGTDIRRVIADAAQRRITVTKGCASNTDQGRKIAKDVEDDCHGFRTKAEEDDANERAIMQAYMELVQEEEEQKYGDDYKPPSESNPAGPQGAFQQSKSIDSEISHYHMTPTARSQPEQHENRYLPAKPEPQPQREPDLHTWTCEICTLVNPLQFLACEACGVERSSTISATTTTTTTIAQPDGKKRKSEVDTGQLNVVKPRQSVTKALASLEAQEARKPVRPMGWTCHVCSNWMESQWWTCARCGNMKQAS